MSKEEFVEYRSGSTVAPVWVGWMEEPESGSVTGFVDSTGAIWRYNDNVEVGDAFEWANSAHSLMWNSIRDAADSAAVADRTSGENHWPWQAAACLAQIAVREIERAESRGDMSQGAASDAKKAFRAVALAVLGETAMNYGGPLRNLLRGMRSADFEYLVRELRVAWEAPA